MSEELIRELKRNAAAHPLDADLSLFGKAAIAIAEQAREIERLLTRIAEVEMQNHDLIERFAPYEIQDAMKAKPGAVVPELIKRAADVVEGLHGEPLPGAMPVRVQKLKAALESLNASSVSVEPAHSDAVSVPTFCAYCGGNDEDPQDHCTDCTEPLPVPRSFLEELDDALTVHIELLNVNDYEPDDVVIAEQRRSDLRALLAGGEV
jgi:hypothetical protein